HVALHLAGGGTRQRLLGESQHLDPLMEWEPSVLHLDMLPHLGLELLQGVVGVAILVGLDEAGDPLAVATIRKTNHSELLDGPMLLEQLLELVWIDVLAGRRDDDVLLASNEVEPPLAVEATEVASVEPPVAQHLLGTLCV